MGSGWGREEEEGHTFVASSVRDGWESEGVQREWMGWEEEEGHTFVASSSSDGRESEGVQREWMGWEEEEGHTFVAPSISDGREGFRGSRWGWGGKRRKVTPL